MMRLVFAALLALHGIAHLVGFAGPWGIASGIAPQTALLAGRIPLGPTGMRIVGAVWLLLAGAFVIVATGVAFRNTWALSALAAVSGASLVMSVLGLPEAKVGVAVNAAILLAVYFISRAG